MKSNQTIRCELKLIVRDAGTQFRPTVNQDHVDTLAEEIRQDGLKEPLKVFRLENGKYVLVDGFHRWEALRKINQHHAEVLITGSGDINAARRKALEANSDHALALPRDSQTLKNCCEAACKILLAEAEAKGVRLWKVSPTAVQKMVKCSDRWAKKMTQDVNQELKERRDRLIADFIDQGQENKEIAENMSCPLRTVQRIWNSRQKGTNALLARELKNTEKDLDKNIKQHPPQKELSTTTDLQNQTTTDDNPSSNNDSNAEDDCKGPFPTDDGLSDEARERNREMNRHMKEIEEIEEQENSPEGGFKPFQFDPKLRIPVILNSLSDSHELTKEDYIEYITTKDRDLLERAAPQIKDFVEALVETGEIEINK